MNSDLQLVENVLQGLMTPNNEERKKAELQLAELMQKNTIGLVLYLSQIINQNADNSILTYSSVVMRKLIQVKENETVNVHWKNANNEMKEEIKKNVLNALLNCNDKSLKKKYGDIASNLCENIYNNVEKWDNILKYVANGFMIDLKPENFLNIESSVFLLSKIFNYAQNELLTGIDQLIIGFHKFFKEGNLDIQTNSVEAICEILTGYIDKKVSKKFREFTIYILQTILNCLNNNDFNNLKKSLFALSDLAQTQPIMLKKNFSDIYTLMGKIIERKDLDEDSIRSVAYEVLLSIIEKYSKVISEDNQKLTLLINSIFKYGMEFDEEIDDDWLTPKSLSLSDEDFIPEGKLDEALSLIDRLIISVKEKTALPIISNIIMELLNHSNESWKYKYIAYTSVGKISTYVDDIKAIETMINNILPDITNQNPKIRYSCLFCIAQFTDAFKEDFTELYHNQVITSIVALENNDNVLRVKLQGFDSLQSFIEYCSESILSNYIQNILESLFSHFVKGDNDCPQNLRETILDTLGGLISNTKDSFKPFSEKSFNILISYLGQALNNNNNNVNLFGLLIDILTQVGENCPDLLQKNSKDIAQTLIHFQNNVSNFKGEFADLFETSWQRILPYIKKEHQDIIPDIIQSIIKVITNPPEMSISSNPNEKIDIEKFLSEVNNTKENVVLEKTKISVITSETEEYSIFLELLNVILTELKEHVLPFVDLTEAEITRVLNYPNADIRKNAASVFPNLINVIESTGDKNKLTEYMKKYISILQSASESEKENSVVSSLLDAMSDIFKEHDKLLTVEEINTLFEKLFSLFDKVEANRLALLKEEDIAEKELEENNKKNNNNDDDESDDDKTTALNNIKDEIDEVENVITSYSDCIGSIFKSHKELSLEIAKKMITDVLPKYFLEKSSTFEKKMGLFIMDDMVEFLGQELLNEIWPNIAKTLVAFVDNHNSELRQASSYGLGEFIKHTKINYEQYANDILNILFKGLQVSSDGQTTDEYGQAQDNIVTAIGKLIKHQGNQYSNLIEIIDQWLQHLPIIYDINESAGMHDLLCDIILEKSDMIFGNNNKNVPKIIRILCKIIDTRYSNDSINEKIKKILDGIKNNSSLSPCIEEAKKDAPKKTLVKIQKYFP